MTYDMPCMQVSGRVDQSAGMLDDDAKEKGYTLLCVSEPQEDCKIATIEEVSSIRAASLYSEIACKVAWHVFTICPSLWLSSHA